MFHWLRSNNFNISLLQETHSNKDCVNKWEREWEGKAFFSGDKSNKEGICILLNENVNFEVLKHTEIIIGKIQTLELKIENRNIMIVNIYGPNNDNVSFF